MNAAMWATCSLVMFAVACAVYCFGIHRRNLKIVTHNRRQLDPIHDMVDWKRKRRTQELREWQQKFDLIALPLTQIPGPLFKDFDSRTHSDRKTEMCSCGHYLLGNANIESHRRQHAWEIRNLGNWPVDYVALWKR